MRIFLDRRKTGKITVIVLLIFFVLSGESPAQDKVNEEELFSEPEMFIDRGKAREAQKPEEEKKTLGFSGEAVGVLEHAGTRGWIEGGSDKDNVLSSYILGKFYIDARLPRGSKYFGNLEVTNNSLSNETDIAFRESFLDFNIRRAVYFRGGKQVLQWGRCYLWNPSDLINVEKKTFIKKIGSREGTFGLKAHAPFGTGYNIYGFMDVNGARRVEDTAAAGKFEFLIKNTEMAFSVWYKDGFSPVYAYDVSTRFLGIDALGEAAVSHGDHVEKIMESGGVLSREKEGGWVPRASVDFGRWFDFMEVIDRVSVNVEFFYNGGGYKENVFKDEKIYSFARPFTDSSGVLRTSGTKKEFLLGSGLYEPNYYSRYYAALFTTLRKFILSDMALALNLIGNLDDGSAILATGVSYLDINDFSAGLTVYAFLGGPDREYTFSNSALTTQATVSLLF